VKITISPAATVNAGSAQTVCASSPQAQLAGSIGGAAASATWSGGAGSYSPSATALNAVYTPTVAEIAAGSVTLTLTTNDPAGPCGPVSAQVKITISPAATVNAGADQTVCASSAQAQLAGAASGGTAAWSGGAGSFSPSASAPNAIYTPTAAEIAAGSVTLTLTCSPTSGPCPVVSDSMKITINPAATVNAGPAQAVCASSPQAQLAGSIGAASSASWSGGGGSYSPSANALNAVYTPSAAEVAAGSVTLTLTTNDPAGPCGPVSAQVKITINPAATVNAGPDETVCASSPQAQLAGSIGGAAASASWSGGAGSYNPSANALNAVYTPTAVEIAAGSATLTLTTNDPAGPCGPVSAQVKITINPAAVVNAGPDQIVCASSPQAQLAGSLGGSATNATWSGGTGAFNPGPGTLNATYTPSAAEIAAGSVTLTLTSAPSGGPCPQANDAMTIFIRPGATVNAGPDQMTCAASPQVHLAGWVGGSATSALWSGGAGSFSPGPGTLNATYTPSPAEVTAGGVTLTLTTNDPDGPCPAVSDAMTITFDAPSVTVPSRTVCSGVSPVMLCANTGRGTPPFTFHWSNGATGQCITVADTGSYNVTMTDAKGCQATASGAFRQRDCTGQLTGTTTTCDTYQSGNADDLSSTDVHVVIQNNLISSISPGVFFYYTKVTAPASDFTIVIQQTRDNPSFPFIALQQGQVSLFNSGCTLMATGVETSPGQASVDVHGATPGQVFIISVKYSLKTLVGTFMDPTTGCHYDFRTLINGSVVDADPNGLQIGAPSQASGGGDLNSDGPGNILHHGNITAGLSASQDGATVDLYRPAPNPFSAGMRMAYAVEAAGQPVSIGVYDLAGRRVRTLADGIQAPGNHQVTWDGRDANGSRVRNGVYFVHVQVGAQARQVRVTFLE